MTDRKPEHLSIGMTMRVTGYDVTYSRAALTVLGGNVESGLATDGLLELRVEGGVEFEGLPVSQVFIWLLGSHQPRESVGTIEHFPGADAFSGVWISTSREDLPHLLGALSAHGGAEVEVDYDSVPVEPPPFTVNAVTRFEIRPRGASDMNARRDRKARADRVRQA